MFKRIVSFSLLAFAAPFVHAAAGFPVGTYTSGDYAVRFADHGKLELTAKGKVVMDGIWSSDATNLKLTDQTGSYACAAPNDTGTYSWKMSGDTVTFTKKKDDCNDRVGALDGQSWKRKS